MIGERFVSLEFSVTPVVKDLFLGRFERYVVSFIFEQSILGVLNTFNTFIPTGSNPLSLNELSEPLTLVPLTVLIVPVTEVLEPGVRMSYVGIMEV